MLRTLITIYAWLLLGSMAMAVAGLFTEFLLQDRDAARWMYMPLYGMIPVVLLKNALFLLGWED